MNDKIFHWCELIDKNKDQGSSADFTVRYCGRTSGSPWDRHRRDVTRSVQHKSWFYRFLSLTMNVFPHIIAETEVDTVIDATGSADLLADALDLREQVLIALFGVGVLNMQSGGLNVVVPLTQKDHTTFLTLHTKTATRLQNTRPCSEEMKSLVEKYGDRIRQYVNAHPDSTGVSKRPYTNKLLECVVQQAMPATLTVGCALVTSIASNIGTDGHVDSTFYKSERRSAEVVNTCFDQLDFWERPFGESSFEPGATKSMSKAGHLPFVDVFPWFQKNNADFAEAGKILSSYLQTTKPLIVLTYGQLPSYLALNSFEDFSSKWFYDLQHKENDESGSDYYIKILGEPQLRVLGYSDDDVVVIPCYHPGYLAQAGLPSLKATALFFYIHQIVWFGMGVALEALEDKSKAWTRKELCEEVVSQTQKILSVKHQFGQTFASIKQSTIDVTTAFHEGKVSRNLDQTQGTSQKTRKAGYQKVIRNKRKQMRKSQFSGPTTSGNAAMGGFEVKIRKTNLALFLAPKNDRERHFLSWNELSLEENNVEGKDGDRLWAIGPLVLPNGIINSATPGKLFLYYTGEGIDVRDETGSSMGEVKPISSGKAKKSTFPISALVLYADPGDAGDQAFLEHWEDLTGLDIDGYLLGAVVPTGLSAADTLGGQIPAGWFAKSTTKRVLPIPAMQYLHQKTQTAYVDIIKKLFTPANPGDLLWLFSEFFRSICDPQEGVTFAMSSPSETSMSVFSMIARFCHMQKYKNHPHRRILLSLAHMPETGIAERCIASNMVVLALETLTANKKKKKSVNLMVNGVKMSTSHWSYTIDGHESFYDGVIVAFEEPGLEEGVEMIQEIDEFTDDEENVPGQELGKRLREEGSDYGGNDSDAGSICDLPIKKRGKTTTNEF
jgi:hypothetical protein